MKRVLMIAAVLCLAGGTVAAQSATPKARVGAGGPRSDLVNDETIRKVYAEFVTAWNAHDAKKMANMYAIDGDLMEPDGMTAKHRDEVEKHFAEEHAGRSRTPSSSSRSTRCGSPAPTWPRRRHLHGHGCGRSNGQPLPPRKGLLTSVLIKKTARGTSPPAAR
jgi:hypothetical protein